MNLAKGSRGPAVSAAQGLLNKHGASPRLRQDGDFGQKTDLAVKAYQSRAGLTPDGVIGPRTWARLTAPTQQAPARSGAAAPPVRTPAPAVQLPPVLAMPANAHAPWLDVARAEVGVHEIRGARHNSRIIEYHAATTLRAQTDEIAWCASFVNWVLREAGYAGTRSAAAASFLDWGTTLQTGREGAIVVVKHTTSGNRGSTGSTSGNHVGFFLSQSGSHISILGGNQSDQVKVSNFSLSSFSVRGYRWPTNRVS
jgi:uncharacterized protein (TIGR02594 family)